MMAYREARKHKLSQIRRVSALVKLSETGEQSCQDDCPADLSLDPSDSYHFVGRSFSNLSQEFVYVPVGGDTDAV